MTAAAQLTLDASTIRERFEAFHAAHPEVYDELVRLAYEARAAGRDKVGIKMLFEVVRWNRIVVGGVDEGWRLNNVFSAHYARLIMQREPDLAGFFETRSLRSA
jgi:hypothetical protein